MEMVSNRPKDADRSNHGERRKRALSLQQARIVFLLGACKRDTEICAALHISRATLRTYLGRLCEGLGVRNHVDLRLVLAVEGSASNGSESLIPKRRPSNGRPACEFPVAGSGVTVERSTLGAFPLCYPSVLLNGKMVE
jgi:DNA-binding CsgD family transcriptional regulator